VPSREAKPALHLEEIQSDWAQQGRKQGFRSQNARSLAEIDRDMQSLYDELSPQKPTFKQNPDLERRRNELADERETALRSVPDMPFKKNWHELALKRALHDAAEGGYERLSWTPGGSQTTNPKVMLGGREAPAAQAERVAKADKGLQGFYDKIVPDYMNKIGKPHGVQVQQGTTKVGTSLGRGEKMWDETDKLAPVHYMDIPPSLKQQLLTKGMPLFEDNAAAAPIAAAAHAGEANVERAMPANTGGRAGPAGGGSGGFVGGLLDSRPGWFASCGGRGRGRPGGGFLSGLF